MRWSTLLSVVVLASTACTKDAAGPHVEQLGAAEFKALAEQKGGTWLDVRTPEEVARGHLPNASVVDLNDPRFEQKVLSMQKDKPVFVYCASGARSSAAAEMLVRMGFTQVYNLLGGIGSWVSAGYPIERSLEALAPSREPGLKPEVFDLTLASESRVLVDFHTKWCAPCRRLEPTVDAIAEAFRGRVKVLKVDLDLSEALAAREKVSGVPVLVLYVDGVERWRRSGETARAVIEAELTRP